MLNRYTRIPNIVLDTYLPVLSEAELKVLLVILRQTMGWVIEKTGKRKVRDRITNNQFQKRTGLSRRTITNTIKRLTLRKLITITDFKGETLFFPKDRKGKSYLYYAYAQPAHIEAPTSAHKAPAPRQQSDHNKR